MADLKFLASDWPTLSRRLDEALSLTAVERAAWLDSLHETESVKLKLRGLLADAASAETRDFLDAPPSLTLGFFDGNETCNDADIAQAGMHIGPYRLVAELGVGGMGSVWLAERADGGLKREVALKLPRVNWSPGLAERMRRERDILASLDHPNIARIYEAGMDARGRPYLALEYVEGDPIDLYCKQHALGINERLRLLLQVAHAVAHAHSRLVVHRDLKPANILVTKHGQVRLLDFGIAKLMEGEFTKETQLTQVAGRALTLDYASPEQIRGEPIGTASDVYSLGVVAYELLAEAKPYQLKRQGAGALEAAIADAKVRLASSATPNAVAREALKGDLDAILNKALKKTVAERYPTVNEFAQDVERHLAHLPVLARPDALGYRAKKFVQRYRFAVGATSAAMLALLIGVAATAWQAAEAKRQRDFALTQLDRAEATTDFLTLLLNEASPSGKPFTTATLLDRGERMMKHAFPDNAAQRVEILLLLGGQNIELMRSSNALSLLKQAYETSLTIDNPALRARSACMYAHEVSRAGRHDEATQLVERALSELPRTSMLVSARVSCLGQAVDIATVRNQGDKAIAFGEEMMRIAARSPAASASIREAADRSLADALRIAERHSEADEHYRAAVNILSNMGKETTLSMLTVLNNWGISVSALGHPREAEALYARAIQIASGIYANGDLPAYLTASHGHVLLSLGRNEEAASAFQSSIDAARKNGDNLTVLKSQMALSSAEIELNRLDDAERELSAAKSQLSAMLPPGHFGWSVFNGYSARLAFARKNYDDALLLSNQTIAAQSKDGKFTAAAFPNVMVRTSILLAMQRPAEALADAKQALEIVQRTAIGGASYRLGQCYLQIGKAQLALGNKTEARDALQQALLNIESTAMSQHPAAIKTRELLAL